MFAMTACWLAFVLGTPICLLNFYLSFVRYPLGRALGYPPESIRNISGIPLLGSALVGLSLIGLSANPYTNWLDIVVIVMDTGGIHWFVVMMAFMTAYAFIYWLIYGKHPGTYR